MSLLYVGVYSFVLTHVQPLHCNDSIIQLKDENSFRPMIPTVMSPIKNNSGTDQLVRKKAISPILINTSDKAIQTAKAVVVGIVRMAMDNKIELTAPKIA